MTRGRLLFISGGENIYLTLEFNGDMYYEDGGKGRDIIEAYLSGSVSTLEDFVNFASKFDRDRFGYQGYCAGIAYSIEKPDDNKLDIREYSSDYLYIFNNSSQELVIRCKDIDIKCEEREMAVTYFSHFDKIISMNDDIAKVVAQEE